jgi:hypothetical protein
VAYPVIGNSSGKSVDKRNAEAGHAASRVGDGGGDSPGRSSKTPVLTAASPTTGRRLQMASTSQPTARETAGIAVSQPIYGACSTLAIREPAQDNKLSQPDEMETLIDHFNLNVHRSDFGSTDQPYEQMAYVTHVLNHCHERPGNHSRMIDLDVPMRKRISTLGSMENTYSHALYRALARTDLVARIRVQGYQPELDKKCWLSNGDLFGNNENITWLELADCQFDDDDAIELASALEANKAIKTLFLRNCALSTDGSHALAEAFKRRPDIMVMDLSLGRMGSPTMAIGQGGERDANAVHYPESFASPGQMLTASSGTPLPFNTASLSNAATSTTTLFDVVSGRRLPGSISPENNASTINALDLWFAPNPQPATTLALAESHFPPAESALLQARSARESALRASAVKTCAAFQGDAPLQALKKVFAEDQWARIELPRSLFMIGASESVLKTGNPYSEFIQREWLEQAPLRYLDLTSEPGSAANVLETVSTIITLLQNCDRLTAQKKSGLRLGIDVHSAQLRVAAAGITRTDKELLFHRLFAALAADTMVVRLSLAGFDSAWLPSAQHADYFESLATNTTLQELDLSNVKLCDSGAFALAKALKQNRSITLIDLRGCTTSGEGGKALYGVLLARRDVEVIQ